MAMKLLLYRISFLSLLLSSATWLGGVASTDTKADEVAAFKNQMLKNDIKLSAKDLKKIEAEKQYRQKLLFFSYVINICLVLFVLPMLKKLYKESGGWEVSLSENIKNLKFFLFSSLVFIPVMIYAFSPLFVKGFISSHFPFALPPFLKRKNKIHKSFKKYYEKLFFYSEMTSWVISFVVMGITLLLFTDQTDRDFIEYMTDSFFFTLYFSPVVAIFVSFLVMPFFYKFFPFFIQKDMLLTIKMVKHTHRKKRINYLNAKLALPNVDRVLRLHDDLNYLEDLLKEYEC